MPRHSYFVEALLDDEAFAEQLLNMPDVPAVMRERVSEWSPLREGLARIEDGLKGVQAAVIAAAGAKPPNFKPAQRPQTAIQRVQKVKRKEKYDDLVGKVLPMKKRTT